MFAAQELNIVCSYCDLVTEPEQGLLKNKKKLRKIQKYSGYFNVGISFCNQMLFDAGPGAVFTILQFLRNL